MKITTFTDTRIRKLKSTDKKYIRGEGNGFNVRVMPSGVKTWLYLFSIGGKRREMKLGNYPEVTLEAARVKFEDARRKVKNGIDPISEKEQEIDNRIKALTVEDLAKEYMERHAKVNKRKSSWTEDERLLNVNVLPKWGKRKAHDIKKRDCVVLLESFMDRPALCHNVLKLTRKMFNFAVERDIIEFSPFRGVKAPVQIRSRERALTQCEIKAFWTTELPKASMSPEVKKILKLALLTGQRVGEICGINTAEIDENWWTIPAERTKNGVTHRVYLTMTALDLLGTPQGFYYFPSPTSNNDEEKHIAPNAISSAVRRNLKNYSPRRPIKGEMLKMVKVAENRKMDIDHFTPHDLRRTCATFLSQLGFMDEVIDAVLNHKKKGVIKIYNKYSYDFEKKHALEEWNRKLSEIINKDDKPIQGRPIKIHGDCDFLPNGKKIVMTETSDDLKDFERLTKYDDIIDQYESLLDDGYSRETAKQIIEREKRLCSIKTLEAYSKEKNDYDREIQQAHQEVKAKNMKLNLRLNWDEEAR